MISKQAGLSSVGIVQAIDTATDTAPIPPRDLQSHHVAAAAAAAAEHLHDVPLFFSATNTTAAVSDRP